MPLQTAAAGGTAAPGTVTDLAALSTAMIAAHAWAKANPGELSKPRPAGYQRTIRWRAEKLPSGAWRHLLVLRREHLAPYDLDHENVAEALMGARDGQGGELAVLERRWMDENDHAAGVCYKIGTPPPPEEPAAAEAA